MPVSTLSGNPPAKSHRTIRIKFTTVGLEAAGLKRIDGYIQRTVIRVLCQEHHRSPDAKVSAYLEIRVCACCEEPCEAAEQALEE